MEQSDNKDVEMEQQIKSYMAKNDFYDILGVPRDADQPTIKNAYRKLALKFHPDKNKYENAKQVFKKVSNAYSTLTDAEKREIYNKYGPEDYRKYEQKSHPHYHQHQYTNQQQMFEDIFRQFFGGNAAGFTFKANINLQGRQQNKMSPMIIMFLISMVMMWLPKLLGSYFQQKPVYSLTRTNQYYRNRKSEELGTDYYVNDEFQKQINQNWGRLSQIQKVVDRSYLNQLYKQCQTNKQQQKNYRSQAISSSDSDKKRQLNQKASQIDLSKCTLLQQIQQQHMNYISDLPQ